MVTLFITFEAQHDFKYEKLLKTVATNLLAQEQVEGRSEINLIITNNTKMAQLALMYKGQKAATDVLSFPSDYQKYQPIIGYNMLGDIFISTEKVIVQAQAYGHSLEREWAYLFAHGLLHLLGYDHQTLKTEKIMHAKVSAVLTALGVTRDEKFF